MGEEGGFAPAMARVPVEPPDFEFMREGMCGPVTWDGQSLRPLPTNLTGKHTPPRESWEQPIEQTRAWKIYCVQTRRMG